MNKPTFRSILLPEPSYLAEGILSWPQHRVWSLLVYQDILTYFGILQWKIYQYKCPLVVVSICWSISI